MRILSKNSRIATHTNTHVLLQCLGQEANKMININSKNTFKLSHLVCPGYGIFQVQKVKSKVPENPFYKTKSSSPGTPLSLANQEGWRLYLHTNYYHQSRQTSWLPGRPGSQVLPATGARRNDGLGEEGAPHKGGHGACALALALAFFVSCLKFTFLCAQNIDPTPGLPVIL